ncbi:formylglycine-generating enzyme required for sulfatase activity [Pseudomonas baetica]|uniref:Formylglycine-generating enzyme required for sulfatase activity n=1 Tax=Pseudomonas baetica TaxID=674054 RepID=A0ABX4PSK6_9PSED|nr:formylglycine-generating enzyme family protein [Pseudomonas baetica]PKA68004.1 formylglycine-generating enzyme required for sulfatase activity [Pseudomonas baetica]PTC18115.1 chromophore maturation protein PvdO [Pseudomonas baetica]
MKRDLLTPAVGAKALKALALAALMSGLLTSAAQAATAPAAGKVFKDCKDCPEMVVLPAGTFTMGTPEDEVGREPDEGPMHDVTFVKPFAMSRFQVTAGEWDSYIRESGAVIANGDTRPGRECVASKPRYPQTPRQPAVCMDFQDIKNYVAWLSKKTGQKYSMLSEAQREYGARAGSKGPFPFPFDEGKGYTIARHANTYGPTDGYSFSSPAGSYPANAFGLYDMHGNVYEWVEDCYHPDYKGAPTDGSAWLEPNCDTLRIRGNDWGEAPVFSRSGNRNDIDPKTRGDWIGFRVVREL